MKDRAELAFWIVWLLGIVLVLGFATCLGRSA